MADINQLIEPITPSNTVNSINIYKIDYLPNVFDANPKDLRLFKEQSPRKIKGKKYENNYVKINPKIGQLKIKQFVSPILKSHWGLVSKAVKIKNTISLNTENDKYMFIKNASKEDLKKIKYDNYFGIRVSDTDLYDFDRRMIFHDIHRDPNDNDVVIIDRNNAEPMIDLSKYKNVFIDKNNFKPIMSYYIKEYYDEDTPEFIGKQQDGVTGSIILPDSINQQDVNQEDQQDVREVLYPERKALYKEQSKVEKDLKKTIVRYVDKYVNFAAANELNNIEDIDYIIDAFNEYAQEENLQINKRSIDAVNRRVNKLYDIRHELDSMPMIRKSQYF